MFYAIIGAFIGLVIAVIYTDMRRYGEGLESAFCYMIGIFLGGGIGFGIGVSRFLNGNYIPLM